MSTVVFTKFRRNSQTAEFVHDLDMLLGDRTLRISMVILRKLLHRTELLVVQFVLSARVRRGGVAEKRMLFQIGQAQSLVRIELQQTDDDVLQRLVYSLHFLPDVFGKLFLFCFE